MEELWTRNPSAEFPLMGLDPAQVGRILRRTERWNLRLALALANAFRRPLFRFLILEERGTVVGTAMVGFSPRVATVGGVTVEASVRRRGHAQALLQACERLGRRYGRRYLVLDVLADNVPATRLYEKTRYKTVRTVRWMARDLSQPIHVAAPNERYRIRPLHPRRATRLARLANDDIPASYRLLVSVRPRDLKPSGLSQRIGGGVSSGWVLERDGEVVGLVKAAIRPAVQAALIGPLAFVGPPEAEACAGLINTALGWCAARHAPRAILDLPEHLDKVLPVLRSEGFTESFRVRTMALDLGAT